MGEKRKVAVFGSNSFSGSDFIDLLLEGGKYSVVGISRSREKSALFLPYKRHKTEDFRFHQLDLNNDMDSIIELLDSFEPEYVVNFAAQSEVAPSWENPRQWFQTNAVAITELAHVLKDRKYLTRYVHISSPEVYGTCTGTVREDTPLNPSTPYAASKAAGDLSLFTFVKNFGFPMVTIRSTNVYGAHQQLFKMIPRTVIYLVTGEKILLHGGGTAIKSYIHIRDISRGELAAMEHGKVGTIYHLSPSTGIAVCDVVRTICQYMGHSFEEATEIVGERLGQDAAYVIDSSRARAEFGWTPMVSLDEGIKEVISWIEQNFAEIKTLPLSYVHSV